ncbi:MAG: hypothetical protein H6551_02705 [Chitinophagales bacterium]|nr:hypothetical protein [Chitinophagaceae bacterium]MCB9064033.1 hypothetical protein [Chitinophagales bacterium]
MGEVIDFFKNLFEYDDFRSFWQSGSWTTFHGWFYIISDLLVWSAYFIIPLFIIVYTIKKGRFTRFNSLYFLFALFILFCGATFLVDAIMFWVPVYRFSALLKFITGILSWLTVVYVIKYTPAAFSLRSGHELEAEIQSRIKIEEELKLKNEQLQEAEVLAKIGYIKWDVKGEQVTYSDAVLDILEIPSDRKLNYDLLSHIIHTEDVKYLERVIDTIFIKKFFPNFYCRIYVNGGEVKHLLVVGQVILSPEGAISEVKGTIQDVTEQREYLHKIQQQNQQLKDIAWIQSHKVRAPVASILGLIQLFNTEEPGDPMNKEILDGVTEAAHNLDAVIREINAKTEENADPTSEGGVV